MLDVAIRIPSPHNGMGCLPDETWMQQHSDRGSGMPSDRLCTTCACCGYQTITEEHDICGLCGWQCDWAQERSPDFPLGANGRITLREAQHNFATLGNCAGVAGYSRGESPSNYQRDSEWWPFPLQPDPVEDAKAWRRVIPPPEPWACSCCGYKTILDDAKQCKICGWYADGGYYGSGPDLAFPDINDGLTIREAQQNYQRFGAFAPSYISSKRDPGPDDARDPDWKPLPPLSSSDGPHAGQAPAARPERDMEAVNIGKNFYKHVLKENLWPGRIEDIVTFLRVAHQFAGSPPSDAMVAERIRLGRRERVVLRPASGDFAVRELEGPEAGAMRAFFVKAGTPESRLRYFRWHSAADAAAERPAPASLPTGGMLTCPCCGHKSITSAFDICEVCLWEHDEYQVAHPDETGANAEITLRQAQHNFSKLARCSEKYLDDAGPSSVEYERDPTWQPLPPLSPRV
jgi:hypothetical protein